MTHDLFNSALTLPVQRPEDTCISNGLPHANFGPMLNLSIWLLTGLSLGFLGLRLYCKWMRHRELWWDDYVLVLSWISLAATASMTSVSITFGYGKHLYDIDIQALRKMPSVANVAGLFSILAALWSKTSFALTLLRISSGWLKASVWVIIVSMNLIMGTSAVLIWVNIPMGARITYFIFSTAYSGAMDILLALLPWKIIWGLVMSRRDKLGVALAMSMGVFAGATSFIKVTKVGGLRSGDPVDSVQLVIFGAAESAITIIAASIPILRALIRDMRPEISPNFYQLQSRHESDAYKNPPPNIRGPLIGLAV